MAIVTNPSFALSGTLNNLVFCRRNGIAYVRTRPTRYHDAESEKQKTARGRFTACTRFYDYLREAVFRTAWKAAAKGPGKTGRGLFIRHNIHAFDAAGRIDDYSRMRLSVGMLPLPGCMRLVCTDDRECVLQWEFEPDKPYGLPTDRLYVFVLREEYEPVFLRDVVAVRSDGKAVLPVDIDAHTHIYGFFGTASESSFSDSVYFNAGEAEEQ